MAKRAAPEVNAGSMADIAFLLLIFFLVTTTIEVDSGIATKLPPKPDPNVEIPVIKKNNVLQVYINYGDQIQVNDENVNIEDLAVRAQEFIDNGAGSCSYCKGAKDPDSSVSPDKAVISLFSDRVASYAMYITVTNELTKAYNVLRDRVSTGRYQISYTQLLKDRDDTPRDLRESDEYKAILDRITEVEKLYPRNIAEGEPIKN